RTWYGPFGRLGWPCPVDELPPGCRKLTESLSRRTAKISLSLRLCERLRSRLLEYPHALGVEVGEARLDRLEPGLDVLDEALDLLADRLDLLFGRCHLGVGSRPQEVAAEDRATEAGELLDLEPEVELELGADAEVGQLALEYVQLVARCVGRL